VALSTWFERQSVAFLWCRLFYLFGEGEHPQRLIPYVRARLEAGQPVELTRCEQVRDFLDVAEAAAQIVEATLGSAVGALNICSGQGTSVRALAERLADQYGRRDLLRFGARPEPAIDAPCVVGRRGPERR
jgi:dTDP-6-deoxy-L-talose 4-dehydrogenase (NAD+)